MSTATPLKPIVLGDMKIHRVLEMQQPLFPARTFFPALSAELLDENYFHAVFESTKGVAERIRLMSGLTADGAELVNKAFSIQSPILVLGPLATESEKSEQKGFSNLLVGLFGAVRNPLAHAPKTNWPMSEQDALDILTLVSLIHRKLDRAEKVITPTA